MVWGCEEPVSGVGYRDRERKQGMEVENSYYNSCFYKLDYTVVYNNLYLSN